MKKLLAVILLINMNLLYSQQTKPLSFTKEFTLKTSDIQTLKKFKWGKLKDVFKESKATDSIKITISFTNKDASNGIQPNIDHISTEVKGQKAELNKLIRTAKKLARQIVKSEKETAEG